MYLTPNGRALRWPAARGTRRHVSVHAKRITSIRLASQNSKIDFFFLKKNNSQRPISVCLVAAQSMEIIQCTCFSTVANRQHQRDLKRGCFNLFRMIATDTITGDVNKSSSSSRCVAFEHRTSRLNGIRRCQQSSSCN